MSIVKRLFKRSLDQGRIATVVKSCLSVGAYNQSSNVRVKYFSEV